MVNFERGEGKMGCLVSLLLMAAFIFLCFKVIPVYMDKLDFEDGLGRIASRAGVESAADSAIVERVLSLASGLDFKVSPSDIKVQRTSKLSPTPEIRITVSFQRAVQFPGYTHVFHFESRVSSFVGRI